MTEDVHFERDTHSYLDASGQRVMSVTQAIKLAGLISYDNVPPLVLENARRRGSIIHELTAAYDRGLDVEDLYDIPEECRPYFGAYGQFLDDSRFKVDREQIEKPQLGTVGAFKLGMTPDRVGTIQGEPVVLEIKNTSTQHPAWGVQLAGYEAALPRPKGHRSYQRLAVQLFPTGRYRLHSYSHSTDLSTFLSAYTVAAFKLKHHLAFLD